jgi:hypothetical protein
MQMKIQTLLIALALAGGAAVAAPNDTAKAPTTTDTAASAKATTDTAKPKLHKAKQSAKKRHAKHHRVAQHHAHKQHVASRHHKHQNLALGHRGSTSVMGAGPAQGDSTAKARQARMDAAYADWKAKAKR